MVPKTPQSIKKEHEELHEKLAKAEKAAGSTGKAAKAVAEALLPHFLKEEECLTPSGVIVCSRIRQNIAGYERGHEYG